jgi:translation initiation factor IF-2
MFNFACSWLSKRHTREAFMDDATKLVRLSKAARELNVGLQTIVEFLHKKGFNIDSNPNTKLSPDMYVLLEKEYQSEKKVKEEAQKIGLDYANRETVTIDDQRAHKKDIEYEDEGEELFIKGAPMDYGREHKPAKPKAVEKPKAEEKVAVPEIPAAPVVVEPEPAPVAEVVIPEPEVEIQKPEPVAETPAPAPAPAPAPEPVTEVPTPEPVHQEVVEEPQAPVEEVAEIPEPEPTPSIGLKVLGKIDLDKIDYKTKPSKKSKDEKKKEEKLVEPEPVVEPVPVPVAEPEPVPEAVKEVVVIVPEKPADYENNAQGVSSKLPSPVSETVEPPAPAPDAPAEPVRADNFMKMRVPNLEGPVILGKIELPVERKPAEKKPVASSSEDKLKAKKKKRKRIKKSGLQADGTTTTTTEAPKDHKPAPRAPLGSGAAAKKFGNKRELPKVELSEEDVQKQIKETLARLSSGGKSKTSKYRRLKREQVSQQMQEDQMRAEEDKRVLKVTEFVTANDLAVMMNAPVTDIISTCMSLGLMVSINQRLDAETLVLIAEDFGYKVEFVSVEVQEAISEMEQADNPEDLEHRAPIVAVMGHVDHGKTLLLDHIRKTNVIAGEAGGITQHIGAYEVSLENGKKITFLDTPGHEAFTAMRARGAKVTDVAIIIVAADDAVMPQTIEAINHAQAAGVPMVFAINKIDKPNANPEKIREQLANLNILVEEWGGKYQCQEISAKAGVNIDLLLEKVLLEAEMLELKANAKRKAFGTVIESSLDKGRGYVAKIIVQIGTLKTGDFVIAGSVFGRVKAMYNERNQALKIAGPSTPLLLLGLTGAPQAGDTFNVMSDEKEAKAIAAKRQQLQREQGLRTQKHITLDEIGRRIAIGDFKELNIIVKGDVDGSVEALSDSLLKLSTQQVLVNVIHKSVGAVTESDVLLASASNAIIVAFQVRPSPKARRLAEQEQIDIRIYSIIYNAINEIKSAIEGMLSPEIEEKILCNVEVREVFKITKVGTVAGCMVLDGKLTRNTRIRIIRDGIVVFTGSLSTLKRFKDDAKEVTLGMECGLSIDNFNDIKVGDIVEGYEEIEVKRKL